MAEKQKSFADYVKDLMSVLPTVNNNPMLSVTSQTDAAKYRENPFYMQDAIRKRIADEEEAKKAAQSGSGMFGAMPSRVSDGGDGAGGGRNYYQEIEDRFYQENLTMGLTPETARTLAEQQRFQIQSENNLPIANFLQNAVGGIGNLLTPIVGSSLFGNKLLDTRAPTVDRNIYRPDAIQEAIARAQSQAAGLSGMEAARLAAERAYGSTPIFDLPVDGGMEAARLAAEQAYGSTPIFDIDSGGTNLGQDNVGGYGYSNPGVENTSLESQYGGFL